MFQFKFDLGDKFDMVIYDKKSHTCSIYEIKHSDKLVAEQAKHLINEEKCSIIDGKYGKITEKCVLYRGKDDVLGEVKYLNVERFLAHLG